MTTRSNNTTDDSHDDDDNISKHRVSSFISIQSHRSHHRCDSVNIFQIHRKTK